MEYIDNLVYESINRYFKILESTGYISDKDTDSLLVLAFLLEFMEEYIYYITEEDLKTINSLANCLLNSSCIFPKLSQYIEPLEPIANYIYTHSVRVSGDDDIRLAEGDSSLRIY